MRQIFFLALLVLGSCSSDKVEGPADDLAYFPLQVGYFQIYEVEETRYELGIPSQSTYQLKTVIADSFENAAGSTTYVIHRSVRNDPQSSWTPEQTWSARYAQGELIVSQGSVPYVSMKFPLRVGLEWDGNAYNNETNPGTGSEEDFYRIISINSACSVNTKSFPECVTVELENNNEYIVFNDQRRETYARNVGLVSREIIQLAYCNEQNRNCIGQQIVDDGIIYHQQILEYGMEQP